MKIAILAAVAAALAVPAWAQTQTPQPPPARGTPSAGARPAAAIAPADREFVRRAAETFAAELEISTLALERGSAAAVRELARRSLADHEAAGEQLVGIARARRVPLEFASELRAAEQRRLAQLKGAAFDRAYLESELAERRRSITLFERALQSTRDPQIRAFASQTLERERRQLAHAQLLGSAWGIPGSSTTPPAPPRPLDGSPVATPQQSLAPQRPSGGGPVDTAPVAPRAPAAPAPIVVDRRQRDTLGARGGYDYSRSATDPYAGHDRGVRE